MNEEHVNNNKINQNAFFLKRIDFILRVHSSFLMTIFFIREKNNIQSLVCTKLLIIKRNGIFVLVQFIKFLKKLFNKSDWEENDRVYFIFTKGWNSSPFLLYFILSFLYFANDDESVIQSTPDNSNLQGKSKVNIRKGVNGMGNECRVTCTLQSLIDTQRWTLYFKWTEKNLRQRIHGC